MTTTLPTNDSTSSKIDKFYTEFYLQSLKKMGTNCYPPEFLVRIMLGTYPELKLTVAKGRVLDSGCGDGRNMVLLSNLGMEIHGMEITPEICDIVSARMKSFGISANIKVGRNSGMPFEDNFFDYVTATSSLYYLDNDDSFSQTMAELTRVMKSKSYLICSLATPETFVLAGAEELSDTRFKVTNDPYGVRNGTILKVFKTKEQIINEFSPYFDDICIGTQNDNYFGREVSLWLLVCKKK